MARRAAAAPVRVRKNMDIDPVKLARARALLGTATDTETVDEALDLVSFRHEHSVALDRLAAAGGLEDAFGREAELAKQRSVARSPRARRGAAARSRG